MDRTRKATRAGNEATLQHVSSQEALLLEQQAAEKLAPLQASIVQLQQTPAGLAELQRRTRAWGECQRMEGETSVQFYGRLRQWLEKDLAPTKLPLHPPRQVE